MRLTQTQFRKFLEILDRIDRGTAHPQVPGRIGRYLRQYKRGRADLDLILGQTGTGRRVDAAVSGTHIGPIKVHPMVAPLVAIHPFPLGETAETLAICEELGSLVGLTMWLKGATANATYNVLLSSPGVRLAGDFRWTPPNRVTTGETQIRPVEVPLHWKHARCVKTVADDVIRPPHALEYVCDVRIGPPSLKCFRSVCVLKQGDAWLALPALGEARAMEIADILPAARRAVEHDGLVSLLAYREPWSPTWTVADGAKIDAAEVFAHAVGWIDFQMELDGQQLDGRVVSGVRAALTACGVHPSDNASANLSRSLLPVARDVNRWLRGKG